jgi:hypothetical protein
VREQKLNRNLPHVFLSFHYAADRDRALKIAELMTTERGPWPAAKNYSLNETRRETCRICIKQRIDRALAQTTVVAVLIGQHTASRPLIDYEIRRAVGFGIPVFGFFVHRMTDSFGRRSRPGPVPKALRDIRAIWMDWHEDTFLTTIHTAYGDLTNGGKA